MTEEMNEQMNVTNLQSGDITKGKVAKIEDKQALIDIGYKYDGVLPIGEVSNLHLENINEVLQVGDEIEVKVIKIDDENEKLILSKRVIDSEKAWDKLKELHDSKKTFEIKVADVVKGGLIADVGVRGFIPASLVEMHFVEDFSDYKGKTLRVRVVELDTEKNKVILSQKAVLEDEEEKRKQEAFKDIKVGEVIEGTVQRLTDFGAFVDLGGVDGLVHISEISWERVKKPSDALKEGDKVKVKILKIDKDSKRISLSIKETGESPWEKTAKELKIGEIYTGKVKRLAGFGAFVQISLGVEGLVHISQISDQHITKPDEVLQVDQEVKVKVLDIDSKDKRISLSIKDAIEKEVIEYDNQGLNVTLGDLFGDKLNKLK